MEIENRLQQILVYGIAAGDGHARRAGSRPALPGEHALALTAALRRLPCVGHHEMWDFIAQLVYESFLAYLFQGPESQGCGLKADSPHEASRLWELRLW